MKRCAVARSGTLGDGAAPGKNAEEGEPAIWTLPPLGNEYARRHQSTVVQLRYRSLHLPCELVVAGASACSSHLARLVKLAAALESGA
jgi:hypothetical protein